MLLTKLQSKSFNMSHIIFINRENNTKESEEAQGT